MSEKQNRLNLWQQRLERDRQKWTAERERMDERERLYAGSHELQPVTDKDVRTGGKRRARHVQNIILENIESEVSTSIPQPKVTARREKDEPLAALIENMLRNELDRLPFEVLCDQQERTCPIQGATAYLVEWDEGQRSPGSSGELAVQAVHPKRLIPQDGVTSSLEEMDWLFLEIPRTKSAIRRAYGVDVQDEAETQPQVRGSGSESAAEELVTQCIAYYRNEAGGVGRFSWVGDTVLEDLDDFQARRLPMCTRCGAVRPAGTREGGECPYCGGTKFESRVQEFEEIWEPVKTARGRVIAGKMSLLQDGTSVVMEPARIPYYRPKHYPLVLQRNVPIYGKLLGQSDVDTIRDQQNTLNRLDKKIIDRICKAGTRITLPAKSELDMDPEDQEIWYLASVADRNAIGAYDFKGDLEYELYYRANVEEQARKLLGITESYQGRNDETAVSGVAKQFAAAQSAGRLESKRVCKEAAYAELFQRMFELKLAYADEPRPVVYQDERGQTVYDSFDRYDFLEQDEAGEWVWNDQFLFSVDAASSLATNRQSMWQEITAAFSSGSFGDPAKTETLMLYWSKMEAQHYPGAAETARYFKDKLEKEQQLMHMQMQQNFSLQQEQMAGMQKSGAGLGAMGLQAAGAGAAAPAQTDGQLQQPTAGIAGA